jgi:hypothetical protein
MLVGCTDLRVGGRYADFVGYRASVNREAGHPLDADTTIAQRRIDGGKTTGSKQPGKSLLDLRFVQTSELC